MLRVFESQAPLKQTASDTIATLASRLSSATLLEDRRAAILGLRSFAKEYPASVSSGALAGLITSLARDGEDVDTVKPALETVLNLFEPLETSLEASDDILLWLADQFTQKQDNFAILLNLLESSSFFSRLYSLQIISAISQARPSKTQQCILYAPLGTTRLVASLRDPDGTVRTAATVLLAELSTTSSELQKLIAYEGAFDHIFDNIEEDGGLLFSSVVAQDSLSLLANLVRHNSSNQTLFRTSGGVGRLYRLLSQQPREGNPDDGSSPVPRVNLQQRDRNFWGLLVVLRLFLPEGAVGTHENQLAFVNDGILAEVVGIAFGPDSGLRVRSEALSTCADMIRLNGRIQEGFAEIPVIPFVSHSFSLDHRSSMSSTEPHSPRSSHQPQMLIEALLNLAINSYGLEMFDVRLAAANCIIAYFHDHPTIKSHFLQRAIEGHVGGNDEVGNAISTLLAGSSISAKLEDGIEKVADPYQVWFASMILFHLLYQDPSAKETTRSVKEGDSEEGEEEVTLIQAVSAMLISILQQDSLVGLEREAIGYLMLLSGWLFEDPASVNDLLEESSIIQVLIVYVTRPVMSNPPPAEIVILRGLCATLIGVIYEFSRKDSPLPRRDLQSIIYKGLGRDKYQELLYDFRHEPHLQDFEVLPQGLSAPVGSRALPGVFFHPLFVEFLKDRFSRITKAIDRDPGKEFYASSEEGIDRDLLDDLRQQLGVASQNLQEAREQILDLEARLNQEVTDRKRENDAAGLQYNQLRQTMEKDHHAQLTSRQQEFSIEILRLEAAHDEATARLKSALEHASNMQAQALKAEGMAKQSSQAREEVSRLLAVCEEEKRRAMADGIQRERKMKEATDRIQRLQTEIEGEQIRNRDWEGRVEELMAEMKDVKGELSKISKQRDGFRVEAEKLKLEVEGRKAELQGGIERLQKEIHTLKAETTTANKLLQESVRKSETKSKELSAKASEFDNQAKILVQSQEDNTRLMAKVRENDESVAEREKEAADAREAAERMIAEKVAAVEKASKVAVEKEVEEVRKKAGSTEAVLERELRALKEELANKEGEIKKVKADREKEVSLLKDRMKELEKKDENIETTPATTGNKKKDKKGGPGAGAVPNGITIQEKKKLEDELEATKAKAQKDLEAASEESRETLEKVRKEIRELTVRSEGLEEGRKTAQTELDDVLLVLTDMEEKKDRYKRRLKGLGEEVSDEEDGDDDDDDDDDDE